MAAAGGSNARVDLASFVVQNIMSNTIRRLRCTPIILLTSNPKHEIVEDGKTLCYTPGRAANLSKTSKGTLVARKPVEHAAGSSYLSTH